MALSISMSSRPTPSTPDRGTQKLTENYHHSSLWPALMPTVVSRIEKVSLGNTLVSRNYVNVRIERATKANVCVLHHLDRAQRLPHPSVFCADPRTPTDPSIPQPASFLRSGRPSGLLRHGAVLPRDEQGECDALRSLRDFSSAAHSADLLRRLGLGFSSAAKPLPKCRTSTPYCHPSRGDHHRHLRELSDLPSPYHPAASRAGPQTETTLPQPAFVSPCAGPRRPRHQRCQCLPSTPGDPRGYRHVPAG